MELLRFNILTTFQCNRFCEGCYSPHTNVFLSSELAQDVAKMITKMAEREEAQRTEIHFFGGETFLNIEPIFNIMDYLSENCPSFVKSDTMIFTNGDFLSKDTLQEVKLRQAKILLNPACDNLEDVEKKMTFIKNICGGVSLSVALNSLNMKRLPELVKLAIKHDSHIRISRLYQGGKDPQYVKEYEIQMVKALNLLLEAEKPMWPNFVVDTIYPTWKGKKNPYGCGKTLVVIDPDGKLRGCGSDVNSEVGTIEKCSDYRISDFEFPNRMSAKKYPECQKCPWVVWCQGGCPYTSKIVYGEYGVGKTPFCSALKTIFPLLMKLVEKWELRNDPKN